MPANRIATITSVLTALGAFIAAIIGVFPQGWQNDLLAVAALLKHSLIVWKFLDGSQKWDALTMTAPVAPAAPVPDATDLNQDKP